MSDDATKMAQSHLRSNFDLFGRLNSSVNFAKGVGGVRLNGARIQTKDDIDGLL
jgi:hypothetical protein